MISNFNLILLCGGHTACDSSWNKSFSPLDECYKMYFVRKGGASLFVDGCEKRLTAGNVYLICGYNIEAQKCSDIMDVYWVHFIPESHILKHALMLADPICEWKWNMDLHNNKTLDVLPELFTLQEQFVNDASSLRSGSLSCTVISIILHYIAIALQEYKIEEMLQRETSMRRLLPAIDYIDDNFRNTLSLKKIAGQVNIAPNYFHKLFVKAMGETPLQYVTKRRLLIARNLLSTTGKTVKEVACDVGYNNEFYFSRIFKKHLNCSPSIFKAGSSKSV